MTEAKGAGMQHLTRTKFEAVADEGAIRGGSLAAQDFLTAIALIVEQWMPDAFHVHANLVRAACFQPTLDKGDMSEAFQDAIVCDGRFARRIVVGQDGHLQTVFRVAANIAANGAFVLGKRSPHEGIVEPTGGVYEELVAKVGLRFGGLGDDKQS